MAIKLYHQVAQDSLAHWLSGAAAPDLAPATGLVREHMLNMVSKLHGIAGSHVARATAKLRAPHA